MVGSVAERFHEELAPAILRVWDDGIAQIRADLREMLRRGDRRDRVGPHLFRALVRAHRTARQKSAQHRRPRCARLRYRLRGSIDLIERRADGALRATDYKTGKARAQDGAIVGGGEILQPILYALTLEKVFPREQIDSGRLYYCTSTGEFKDVIFLSTTKRASPLARWPRRSGRPCAKGSCRRRR